MKKTLLFMVCAFALSMSIQADSKLRIFAGAFKDKVSGVLERGKELAVQKVVETYVKSRISEVKGNPVLAYPVAALFAALTLYNASEVLLDMHVRYLDLKPIYIQAEQE